ncbi:MAG: hypothetical protein P4N59_14670, partial [Negativicutes bacterium]|nr:hypothetical protein [Negativicutes bacterium]
MDTADGWLEATAFVSSCQHLLINVPIRLRLSIALELAFSRHFLWGLANSASNFASSIWSAQLRVDNVLYGNTQH